MITQSSGDTGYIMHNRASTLTIGAGSQDRITIDRDALSTMDIVAVLTRVVQEQQYKIKDLEARLDAM